MDIAFLTGLPRSGSTLLCSILSQNPKIVSGRISNLCDLMWNAQWSLDNYAGFTGKQADNHDQILSSIPGSYYAGHEEKIVIDQCRAWTIPANMAMITKFISDDPRIICLTRDEEEVRQSYRNLFSRNGRTDFDGSGFEEELMRNIFAVENAKTLPKNWVHFVEYNDLVSDTENVLRDIYKFLNKDFFEHDLENIVCSFEDNESITGLVGLHEVRSSVGFRNKSIS